MSANIVYAILVTSLATFLSRFLGALTSEGIKETLIPGLKIIGANTDLAAAEVELTTFENREYIFKSIFAEINNFDFINK